MVDARDGATVALLCLDGLFFFLFLGLFDAVSDDVVEVELLEPALCPPFPGFRGL